MDHGRDRVGSPRSRRKWRYTSSSNKKRKNFETRNAAHAVIPNASNRPKERSSEPMPTFAFNRSPIFASDGLSRPKKFNIRSSQKRTARNSSARQARR